MNCIFGQIDSPTYNELINYRLDMDNIRINNLFSEYSESVKSIKELEKNNNLSSRDTETLITILSIMYTTSRVHEMLEKFSLSIDKKLQRSFENLINKLITNNE